MKTIAFLGILYTSKAHTIEKRDVSPFKKLEVSDSTNVIYKKSDTLSVKVESNPRITN